MRVCALLSCLLLAFVAPAGAQSWPSRPIKLVVPTGPGAVAGHCRCASTIHGQFPHCAAPESRENAGVGRPFALCIVRAMLSRIDSDPVQPKLHKACRLEEGDVMKKAVPAYMRTFIFGKTIVCPGSWRLSFQSVPSIFCNCLHKSMP